MKRFIFSVLVVFAITTSARADVTGTGVGGTIPDNDIVTGFTSGITFASNQVVTGNVVVTLTGLNHTFVGDLAVGVLAPDNTTYIPLFARPGRVTTGNGDSSNLNGTYTFSDSPVNANGTNFWTEATLGGDNYVLRPGQFRATTLDSSTPVAISPIFAGKNTLGTWRLRIFDARSGNTGTIGSWTFSMSSVPAVPEPSGLMLFGLAGVLALSARRRRSPVA